MTKVNDPKRERSAWIRCCAAVLLAVILLAVSGFGIFKMTGTPADFAAVEMPGEQTLEPVGSTEDVQTGTIPASQVGDYVQHEVFLLLANFAEGSRGDTVTERYAVVPVSGKMVTFCFPQRWFASEDAIDQATQDLLNGRAYSIDSYIRVTGTVAELPDTVADQLYSWFGENKEWMEQGGLIPESDDYADVLSDVMVKVDYVGGMTQTAVVALTAAAGVCLLYAIYELIRILCKGFAPKAETAEAEAPAASAETEDAEDIEVEITESDPETGEDVTDLEVEITEEPAEGERSEAADGET